MPARSFQINKRSTSVRVYSGSRFGGKGQKFKILKSSEVSEQKKQIEERRKKKQEELRKTFLITREHIIDLFSTGLAVLMCQKITEAGMTANQEPEPDTLRREPCSGAQRVVLRASPTL
jgi:hypothetical protein